MVTFLLFSIKPVLHPEIKEPVKLPEKPVKLDRTNGNFGLPSSDGNTSEIYSDIEDVGLDDVLAKLDQKAVDVSKVDLKAATWSESSNSGPVVPRRNGSQRSQLKVVFSLGCLCPSGQRLAKKHLVRNTWIIFPVSVSKSEPRNIFLIH